MLVITHKMPGNVCSAWLSMCLLRNHLAEYVVRKVLCGGYFLQIHTEESFNKLTPGSKILMYEFVRDNDTLTQFHWVCHLWHM